MSCYSQPLNPKSIQTLSCVTPIQAELLAALAQQSLTAPGEGWQADHLRFFLAQPGKFGWLHSLDAQPTGFILAQVFDNEAEILSLAVLESWRRFGYGRALLKYVQTTLRQFGVTRFCLEVAADNAAAVALYQQQGFRQIAVRIGYYAKQPGETKARDALVLEYFVPDR